MNIEIHTHRRQTTATRRETNNGIKLHVPHGTAREDLPSHIYAMEIKEIKTQQILLARTENLLLFKMQI